MLPQPAPNMAKPSSPSLVLRLALWFVALAGAGLLVHAWLDLHGFAAWLTGIALLAVGAILFAWVAQHSLAGLASARAFAAELHLRNGARLETRSAVPELRTLSDALNQASAKLASQAAAAYEGEIEVQVTPLPVQ